jgi:hypothetical protein
MIFFESCATYNIPLFQYSQFNVAPKKFTEHCELFFVKPGTGFRQGRQFMSRATPCKAGITRQNLCSNWQILATLLKKIWRNAIQLELIAIQ